MIGKPGENVTRAELKSKFERQKTIAYNSKQQQQQIFI